MTTGIRSDASGTFGALTFGGDDVLRFGSDNSGQLAGFRNKIINGGFDVWQRGVAYLPAPVGYTADRWAAYTANTNVHRRSLGGGSLYYLELNTGGAVTNPQIAQRIEAANAVSLANKKATISLLARRPSGSLALQANVAVATVEDNFASKTTIANVEVVPAGAVLTTWQKFSVTVDIPASAKNGIEIILYANGSAAITFDIAQVQLEEGPIVTPFEQRPIGLELSLCQRYYCKTFPLATPPAQNIGSLVGALGSIGVLNASGPACQWNFPVQMRTTPTITTFNPRAANTSWRNVADTANIIVVVAGNISEHGVLISAGTAGTGTDTWFIHATASAEL